MPRKKDPCLFRDYCANTNLYLAELPLELETCNGCYERCNQDVQLELQLQVQQSGTILQPVSRSVGAKETAIVDSPLSNNFKAIKKYVGVSKGSCHSHNHLHPVFKACDQIQPIPIRLIIRPLLKLRKVGEGAVGEVYLGSFHTSIPSRIFKIVAIEGQKLPDEDRQRTFAEIEPEIKVCQHLTKLRTGFKGCYTDGFAKLYNARICTGKYPRKLLSAWRAFKVVKGGENSKPDFPPNQYYAVFEHDFCGTDICSYHFKNHLQSVVILLQVAHALATAEKACKFEHRDLHWGNVLIQETNNPYNVYTILKNTYRVPCCGLTSTIIDFSNSRVTSDDNEDIFFDLANDEDQFLEGPCKIQSNVYQRMKSLTRNKWHKYSPKSNVLWMHYLTCKLLTDVTYTDVTSDDHFEFTKDLKQLRSKFLKCRSCAECVENVLPPFISRLDKYRPGS